MTDDPPVYNRRATDRHPGDTPQARRLRLARFMRGDPLNTKWLANHNADLLERVARHIALAGHKEAASKIRHVAQAHRDGDVSPF